MPAAQLSNRQARFRFTQEANDLFFVNFFFMSNLLFLGLDSKLSCYSNQWGRRGSNAMR